MLVWIPSCTVSSSDLATQRGREETKKIDAESEIRSLTPPRRFFVFCHRKFSRLERSATKRKEKAEERFGGQCYFIYPLICWYRPRRARIRKDKSRFPHQKSDFVPFFCTRNLIFRSWVIIAGWIDVFRLKSVFETIFSIRNPNSPILIDRCWINRRFSQKTTRSIE